MRTIWKFLVTVNDEINPIDLSEGARVVHAEPEAINKLWVWIELDTEAEKFRRHFRVFGTGQAIPDGFEYRATVHAALFYWHLYERVR